MEFFLAVFVSSILLLPAVLLLWMWDQETPTPKRESGVGNGEKLSRLTMILPHRQIVSSGVHKNLI